jgi:hypothetical protein
MDKQIIYNAALVLHIVGIIAMAGTTFMDYLGFKQYWKLVSVPGKSDIMKNLLSGYQRIMGIGMLVIILSGVLMMLYVHTIYGPQVWFRIKIGILLLVIMNILLVRRSLVSKLWNGTAHEGGTVLTGKTSVLKSRIRLFHLVQMGFFIAIFVLSIFKFN